MHVFVVLNCCFGCSCVSRSAFLCVDDCSARGEQKDPDRHVNILIKQYCYTKRYFCLTAITFLALIIRSYEQETEEVVRRGGWKPAPRRIRNIYINSWQ